MKIPSGSVNRYIYFVAVDSTDLKTREPGLSSFTVYYARNNESAAADASVTISELDATNMPGLYRYLVTEDTTLDAGNDTEEYVVHITHASMAPVTRVIDIYRPETTEGETIGVLSGDVVDVTNITNAVTTDTASRDASKATGFATPTNITAGTITTVTTNTDMRGTDNANTVVPDAAGVAPTTTEIVTAFKAGIVEGAYNFEEMMRIMFAVLSSKSTGGGTNTLSFRDSADAKNRVVATVDVDGNRLTTTLDGS